LHTREKKTVTLGKYVIHMVDLRFRCYRTHNNDFRKDTLHVGCCSLKSIFLKFKGKVILHGVGYTISCGFSFSQKPGCEFFYGVVYVFCHCNTEL